jgi:GTP-binding protein EngB required for normal cell division
VTALVEGAKRLVGRGGSDVADRVEALAKAVSASRGRLPDHLVEEAAEVVDRASSRLRLSAEHTVVALAGATGSGKSSTFNALTGLDLSAVGVKRPTTSWTTACTWGAEGAGELLEWLGVPRRHQVMRNSMLDQTAEETDLQGLVLLDLPDHDSTEISHHLEVDRLVRLTDLLVWVLDPQKYADAAIHDRYLRPLATHKDLMIVVLNHIDEVPESGRAPMLADLRRLLDADGLTGVPVIATSAKYGEGVDELTKAIASRVTQKRSTRDRIVADLAAVSARLEEVNGTAKPKDVARPARSELVDSFADAAGVPTVVSAVQKSTSMRAHRATGWPVTSWLSRLRPDPLKRLHLDLGAEGRILTGDARSSIPQPTQVQRARVDASVRTVADHAAEGLTRPWAAAIRSASVSRLPDLGDALDAAVTGTDLGVSRTPLWWRAVRFLQWLLILTALGGAVWLGSLAVMGYLQLPEPETPRYRGLPLPTLMLVGGVLAGILLDVLCRLLTKVSARSKARSADRRLRGAIGEVTDRLVIEPIEDEVTAYRTTRECLAVARQR